MKTMMLALLLPLSALANEWTTDNPNELTGGFPAFSRWENDISHACGPSRIGASQLLADSLLPSFNIDSIAASQKKEFDSAIAIEHLDLVNLDYARLVNDSFEYRQLCAKGEADELGVSNRLEKGWDEYEGNHAKMVEELNRLKAALKEPGKFNAYDASCATALDRALVGIKKLHGEATGHRELECKPAK